MAVGALHESDSALQGDTLNSNLDINIGLWVTRSCYISSEGSSSSVFGYLVSWPRVKKAGRCLLLTARQPFVPLHNQTQGSDTSTCCPWAVGKKRKDSTCIPLGALRDPLYTAYTMLLMFIALYYFTQQEQILIFLPVTDRTVRNKLCFSNTSLLLQLQKQSKGRSHTIHPMKTLNNEIFFVIEA